MDAYWGLVSFFSSRRRHPRCSRDWSSDVCSSDLDVGNVGVLRDGYREVEKGVQPSEFVVRAGMQRLRPGMEVKPERYDEKALLRKASEKDEPAKGAAGHDAPAAKGGGAAKPAGATPSA